MQDHSALNRKAISTKYVSNLPNLIPFLSSGWEAIHPRSETNNVVTCCRLAPDELIDSNVELWLQGLA